MATLIRYQVAWSGGAVAGPGVSTFYFTDGITGFKAAVSSLFISLGARFPAGVSWSFPSSGDLIDETTGDLVGVWNDGSASTGVGTGAGAFAKGVGARIVWNTAGTTNNRRVSGTTFMLPVDGASLQTDGTLNDTVRGEFQTAANTFLGAVDDALVVWTRPRAGVTGKSSPVVSATVPDGITWLRSRRT